VHRGTLETAVTNVSVWVKDSTGALAGGVENVSPVCASATRDLREWAVSDQHAVMDVSMANVVVMGCVRVPRRLLGPCVTSHNVRSSKGRRVVVTCGVCATCLLENVSVRKATMGCPVKHVCVHLDLPQGLCVTLMATVTSLATASAWGIG